MFYSFIFSSVPVSVSEDFVSVFVVEDFVSGTDSVDDDSEVVEEDDESFTTSLIISFSLTIGVLDSSVFVLVEPFSTTDSDGDFSPETDLEIDLSGTVSVE